MIRNLPVLFCALLLTDCSKPEEKYPEFEVVDTLQMVKDYGAPYLLITIQNTGDAPGYNVTCEAIVKSKTKILDSALAYFKRGETIFPGEKAYDEAIFHNINYHNNYSFIEYKLKWNAQD